MPYKQLGEVKKASKDVLLNLEIEEKSSKNKVELAVYTTSLFENLKIILRTAEDLLFEKKVNVAPEKVYQTEVEMEQEIFRAEHILEVFSATGELLLEYQPEKEELLETPDTARAAEEPEEIKTVEELYLTGLHLEQYRHATYEPGDYYRGGLKRDPDNIRINNAYGRLLFWGGAFSESEKHFRRAIEKLTWKNPNPYDGEAFFNLGLALKMQDQESEAYDVFYKATWSGEWQASGYYQLSLLASRKKDYTQALKFINQSIINNYHHLKARNLKTILLRKLDRLEEAEEVAEKTKQIDKLDFICRNELSYIYNLQGKEKQAHQGKKELMEIMRDSHHNYLESARDYAAAGFFREAIEILERFITLQKKKISVQKEINPLIFYYLAYFHLQRGEEEMAVRIFKKAALASPDYCFPNCIYSIPVLETAMQINPDDAKAPYYLGNIFYDKKQYQKAIKLWEKAAQLDDK